jgi:outer membrane protein assembly factor BamB
MNNPRMAWAAGGLAALWIGTWTWGLAQVPPVQGPPQAKKPAVAAAAAAPDDDADTNERVQLPRDNLVRRKLEESQRLIDAEDWPQTIRLLQTLLDAKKDNKENGDVFVHDKKNNRWVTARVEANRLLGKLPREGLQFYEQHFGGEAYSLLKKGIAAGDPQIYADVSMRYMHTEAGVEAAALLGAHHLDHGRYIMAALSFERLLDREGVLDKMAPLTLYKAALAFERAGDAKNVDRVWNALTAKLGQAGQPPLPSALRKLTPEQLRATLATKDHDRTQKQHADWPMYLGAADRDGVSSGGAPFLEARFERPCYEEADTKNQWIDKAIKHKPNSDDAILGGFQPIAVGDTLIYRTYGNVYAISLKTNELKWKTQPPPLGSLDNLAKERGRLDPNRQVEQWIQSYLASAPHIFYDNSTLGTLSTDYQFVYVVEDMAVPPHPSHLNMAWGGRAWNNAPTLSSQLAGLLDHNALAAYDLRSGKIAWQIPDPDYEKRTTDPFGGTFFLGPPLPLGGKLYLLAEVAGDIKLMCFDPPKTKPPVKVGETIAAPPPDPGEMVWTQTLCTLTEKRLPQDPTRRTQAVHLAYGDGILVCPTNAGIVVGVDLLTRSLVWAHIYQNPDRNDIGLNQMVQPGMPVGGRFRGQMPTPFNIIPPAWSAAAPIVQDGMVVFTAPDGDSVRCLNLRNGAKVWELPREIKEETDLYLYLAGIYQGKVLLVGKKHCYAVGLADGKQKWKTPITVPSGRGAANGQQYFLPLQSGEVWTLDIATGAIQGKSRAVKKDVPGNLVFHNGDVISQSPLNLAVFTQLEVKEREISSRLGQNPNDPKGLAERGELRLHRGDLIKAVEDFRAALAQKPVEEVEHKARAKLYDALADLLEQNFTANEKLLPEFQQLTKLTPPATETAPEKAAREQEQRDRQARYLWLVARGRESQSRFRDALDAYLDFAALGQGNLTALPSGQTVLPHLWAQGRILDLLHKATPEQRSTLEQVFQERWQQTEQDGGLVALRQFADYFAPLCAQGRRAKLLLAKRLAEANQTTEARLELFQLINNSDAEPPLAAQAHEALAQLCLQAGDLETAGFYYRKLGQQFGKVTVRDGKTGLELYQEAATDKRLLPYLDKPGSPLIGLGHGRFEHEVQSGRFVPTSTVFWLDPEGDVPALLRRYRIGIDPGTNAEQGKAKIIVNDQFTNKETTIAISPLPLQSGLVNPQKYRPPCRLLGSIAVFSWLDQVYAVDLTHADRLLWQKSLLEKLELNAGRVNNEYVTLRLDDNGRLELVYQNGYFEKIGMLTLAEPDCVCFVAKDRGLVAVHPLTGKEKWVRSDVTASATLFGDNQYLYLIIPSASEGGPSRTAALRVLDGTPVMTPDFADQYQHKVRLLGRHLLLRDTDAQGNVTMRLYDIQTGKDLWRRSFERRTGMVTLDTLEPSLAGVIDATGKVTIFSALTGADILQAEIDAATLTENPEVHLLHDDRWYYLAFNIPVPASQKLIQRRPLSAPFFSTLRTVAVNGPIIAIDPAQGSIAWRREVGPQALIVNQFDDLPLVLCATMQVQSRPNQGGQLEWHSQLYNVLALDKRDGAVIYEEEKQGNPTNTSFYSIKVDPRLCQVELTSQFTKLMFRQGNEQAQR